MGGKRFKKRNARRMKSSVKEESREFHFHHWAHEAVAAVSCAVFLAMAVSLFWRPVVVQGESMFPTLSTNDRLILYCFDYTPERGDIVVIRRENAEPLIKRVIAVGGDTVQIQNQRVYLNGELLWEPYLTDGATPSVGFSKTVTVPEGHLFVLGDNRSNSHDSRHADIGMVNIEMVVGKAVFRLDPFQKLK